MKWAVEIQNTSLERRNLADLLDGLGFKLTDGIQYPAFTSPEIDICDTAKDVFEKAKELRVAFTGPARIDSEFVLGSVVDYSFDPPRRHTFVEIGTATIKLSGKAMAVVISPPKGLSADELEKWEKERAEQKYQAKLESQRAPLEPAFLNAKAAKVLELLSIENPSGETIYKIYELAEGDPGNRKAFQAQFEISEEQFARFKDAVHNPKVHGDWASHAREGTLNSNNPMSKKEAEQFVRQIALKWLDYVRTSKVR